MAIAAQIKVLREQRGWTQKELADVSGMKQERICALEDIISFTRYKFRITFYCTDK
jgi:transcriptional regulator with XRE-family HTH domain